MDQELLEILCCPATHQPLALADEKALAAARTRTGKSFTEGLLRADGQILYPVMNGIPLLLVEEGVSLV